MRGLLSLMFACLPLLVAPRVLAQTDDRAVPDARTIESAPAEQPVEAPDRPVMRAFVAPAAGLGFIAAGTVLGTGVGSILVAASPCDPSRLCFNGLALAAGASIGAAAGLALLYPLGVALGADSVGGRGGIGWAYLGGLIGDIVAAGFYAAGFGLDHAAGGNWEPSIMVPALLLGIGAALAGPVIAYEISDHFARREARSDPRAELTWMPTLALDASGASAGVVGSF